MHSGVVVGTETGLALPTERRLCQRRCLLPPTGALSREHLELVCPSRHGSRVSKAIGRMVGTSGTFLPRFLGSVSLDLRHYVCQANLRLLGVMQLLRDGGSWMC